MDLIEHDARVLSTLAPSSLDLGLGWLFSRRSGGSGLMLASCAELIVLKAAARKDRAEVKDLYDVARIALFDFQRGEVRAELRAAWSELPGALRAAMFGVRESFAKMDENGPSAFVELIRGQLRLDEDLEDDIRQQLVDAVLTLLDFLDA